MIRFVVLLATVAIVATAEPAEACSLAVGVFDTVPEGGATIPANGKVFALIYGGYTEDMVTDENDAPLVEVQRYGNVFVFDAPATPVVKLTSSYGNAGEEIRFVRSTTTDTQAPAQSTLRDLASKFEGDVDGAACAFHEFSVTGEATGDADTVAWAIYRDDVLIGGQIGRNLNLYDGTSKSGRYCYQVAAIDAAGNLGERSAEACVGVSKPFLGGCNHTSGRGTTGWWLVLLGAGSLVWRRSR